MSRAMLRYLENGEVKHSKSVMDIDTVNKRYLIFTMDNKDLWINYDQIVRCNNLVVNMDPARPLATELDVIHEWNPHGEEKFPGFKITTYAKRI
jgi:hypothetical protein